MQSTINHLGYARQDLLELYVMLGRILNRIDDAGQSIERDKQAGVYEVKIASTGKVGRPNNPQAPYECRYTNCEKRYTAHSSRGSHEIREHGKLFTTSRPYKKREHNNEEPVTCKVCNKQFLTKNSLRGHMGGQHGHGR
jgi:hypothetical protein